MLRRAVRTFKNQSYRNKELVIVFEEEDIEMARFLSDLQDPEILMIKVPSSPRRTLGAIRNFALAQCGGDYFCVWDDDDYYHKERLAFQMSIVQETRMPACVIFQLLVFDTRDNQAYLSCMRPWEGSLLCRKSAISRDLGYEDRNTAEDTPLINRLFSKNMIFPAVMPKLYIYVYHGSNVWNELHFQSIFDTGIKLSPKTSRIIKEILDGKYSCDEASHLLDEISD